METLLPKTKTENLLPKIHFGNCSNFFSNPVYPKISFWDRKRAKRSVSQTRFGNRLELSKNKILVWKFFSQVKSVLLFSIENGGRKWRKLLVLKSMLSFAFWTFFESKETTKSCPKMNFGN